MTLCQATDLILLITSSQHACPTRYIREHKNATTSHGRVRMTSGIPSDDSTGHDEADEKGVTGWWFGTWLLLSHMGMGQYLLIPFLGGWTSIYQLFWCELQGYKVLTHPHILGIILPIDELHDFSRWLLHHQPGKIAVLRRQIFASGSSGGPEEWKLDSDWSRTVTEFPLEKRLELYTGGWLRIWFMNLWICIT